jgi:hypothetical protein
LGNVAQKLQGLARGPAQGVENLPGVDHFLEPLAGFRRPLHGNQQRQQARFVGRAGVLAQCLPQRQMLRLGLRRKTRGVGGQKRERGIGVPAVLRKVEMHAAHQVPGGVAALQKILHAALGFGQLHTESRVQLLPQSFQHRGRQVLRPHHERRRQRHPLQFFVRRGRHAHALLLRAQRSDVARAEFAPPGEHRRQCGAHFVRAQQQEPVARSPLESRQQTIRERGIQRRRGGIVSQHQVAVRGERQAERSRVHAHATPSA